jgi:tRNA isopentenyl-2-thiomethyl-A-37 hydroxylase MiaE
MKLGELLIRANLVTEKDVTAALQRQVSQGGTLGDNLVALGLIDARTIDRFIHRVPQEPADIEAPASPTPTCWLSS